MKNHPLHPKNPEEIIAYIDFYNTKNLRPPALREIMKHFGYHSTRAVTYHTDKLVQEGKLLRLDGSRGLMLP